MRYIAGFQDAINPHDAQTVDYQETEENEELEDSSKSPNMIKEAYTKSLKNPKTVLTVLYAKSLQLIISEKLKYSQLSPELQNWQIVVEPRDIFNASNCYVVQTRSGESYGLFLQTQIVFMINDKPYRSTVWFEQDRHQAIHLCCCLRPFAKPSSKSWSGLVLRTNRARRF